MINCITTGVFLLVIVSFSFFIGTLMGSDNQAAKDQKVIDQYDRMVNERDAKIERLKIQLRCKEEENG